MSLDYAAGHDLLEAFVAARVGHDGDAWTALFTEDAEVWLDPFATPLAGHLDLRAYLNTAAESERQLDLVIERHWVAGNAVLAAWHAGWRRRADDAVVRQAGFLAAEVGDDGRISRLRQWFNAREQPAG